MKTNQSNTKQPRYELQSVFSDGAKTPPQIVPVNKLSWDAIGMNRRNFLGAGLTAVAALTFLQLGNACSKEQEEVKESSLIDCGDIRAHTNYVRSVAISSNGKLLASGSEDKTIKLWNMPDGALLRTLDHASSVRSAAISPDVKLLVSGLYDHSIKLWNLPDGTLLRTLTGHTGYVLSVAISPDGKLLASGSYGRIKLWSLPDGAMLRTLRGHTGYVFSVAINLYSKLLASGSRDNTIKLWSLPNGNHITCLIDLEASPSSAKGMTFKMQNEYGQTVTYTLPCGSPIPAGATCTCNCVSGSYVPPSSGGGSGGGGSNCTCNQVCTCVPVYR